MDILWIWVGGVYMGFSNQNKKLTSLFGFIALKTWLLLEKFFKKVFFLVIKSFLKNKEEPNIDLLTLDYLKTFFKVHVLLTWWNFWK
jgi:hypothetical protein